MTYLVRLSIRCSSDPSTYIGPFTTRADAVEAAKEVMGMHRQHNERLGWEQTVEAMESDANPDICVVVDEYGEYADDTYAVIVETEHNVCDSCGAVMPLNTKRCPECKGDPNEQDDITCKQCENWTPTDDEDGNGDPVGMCASLQRETVYNDTCVGVADKFIARRV